MREAVDVMLRVACGATCRRDVVLEATDGGLKQGITELSFAYEGN